MELRYHPLVKRDLGEILRWYDERSDSAGDRFFGEFEKTVQMLLTGKSSGYPLDQHSRKIRMRRFPYSISYEVTEDLLYVFVVKHQSRNQSVGMRRRRPSDT